MAKLLRLLEQDCTLTHEQLASMTDMTVADEKAAIQRYEADKTILGYQAIVDWDRTDREAVTALIEVKVTPQRGDGFDRVAERIYQYDEVESLVFSQCLAHGMAPLTELYQGQLIPSQAFAEGGIHEAIMAYEDTTFFEILAQELALRDMDDPPITEENYDEVMNRMNAYLGEFEAHGTDHISVDME